MASFKKLGTDNWQVSFYCKDYLGNNKKYKKSGFRTKSLANEYANDFIAKTSGSSEVMLFTVVDEYLEFTKNKVRTNSFKMNQITSRNIKTIFTNIPLIKIDEKYLLLEFEKLNSTPLKRKRIKSFFNLLFDYAKITYKIKRNISREFKLPRLQLEKKDKTIITLEEFKHFINMLKLHCRTQKSFLKYKTFYFLLYFTGIRMGEACGLTVNDIDTKKKTISINRTRIDRINTNPPKSLSSIRTILIHDELNELLKQYIKTLPNIKNQFIFDTDNGIYSNFYKVRSLAELETFTIHGFRHSHASFLISQGIDIVSISKRLGHSNPSITLKIYSHFYKK